MNEPVDPDAIRWLLSFAIFLVGAALSVVSYFGWRRERDRKLVLVTVAYALFALRGLATVTGGAVESTVELPGMHPSLLVVAVVVFNHLSALLVLVGLVLFFVALTRS
ncbi:MAG: hypothetical protein ABEJ68_10890 [Halobacteriaceae archaeon]